MDQDLVLGGAEEVIRAIDRFFKGYFTGAKRDGVPVITGDDYAERRGDNGPRTEQGFGGAAHHGVGSVVVADPHGISPARQRTIYIDTDLVVTGYGLYRLQNYRHHPSATGCRH